MAIRFRTVSRFLVFSILAFAHTAWGQTIAPNPPGWADAQPPAPVADATATVDVESPVLLAQAPPPRALQPSDPSARRSTASTTNPQRSSADSQQGNLSWSLFGGKDTKHHLDEERRLRAIVSGGDVALGREAFTRTAGKSDDLLDRSSSVLGVSAQKRTPISTDIRVRAERRGQLLASGSFWFPARADLDTMMNKIDSRIVDHLILIKGPYSSRYGPGFAFVDMALLQSPRYENGYDWNGSTSLIYKSNGEQWFGRQSISGGNENWGYRVSYGHSTGNDYEDGAGVLLPTSFNSRDFYATIGADIDASSRWEFSYIRLDQTDVEFPGLVYDIDYLVTDGFELTYETESPFIADSFVAEAWFNRTRFAGNTLRPGKNRQIPILNDILFSPSGTNGFAFTDVDAASVGYRFEWTWENNCGDLFSLGTDLIRMDQELNDVEPLLPPINNNFPIPNSYSNDFGVFTDYVRHVNDRLTINSGGRLDFVNTHAVERVDGVPENLSTFHNSELDQEFVLWSAFLTGQYEVDNHWTLHTAVGAAERPPTLTELYAADSFIGSLQRGLTFVQGDPRLAPERLKQIDVGLDGEFEYVRIGGKAFHAWIENYITYDLITPPAAQMGLSNGVHVVNTDLATLSGVETYGEFDLTCMLTAFGNLTFTEGRDRGRRRPSRGNPAPRSSSTVGDHEPLPGIPPLDALVGFRLHDPGRKKWGAELTARIVDNQDRIAASLQEIATPGFTTWDVRSYVYLRENFLFTAGVENFTDKFYREHLDYRSGVGVFRPGINYYFGAEVTY